MTDILIPKWVITVYTDYRDPIILEINPPTTLDEVVLPMQEVDKLSWVLYNDEVVRIPNNNITNIDVIENY